MMKYPLKYMLLLLRIKKLILFNFLFEITSVRGKLEMVFPKYLGGSSFPLD
jgi:hypothetical protein